MTLDLLEQLDQLGGVDWSLVGGSRWMMRWARRLWPLERHHPIRARYSDISVRPPSALTNAASSYGL